MRQYERNGVTVDQCTECRGIFLDRGELERLTQAENAWHGAHQQHAAPPPPQQQHYPQQQHGYRDHDSGEYPRYDKHQKHGHGHHKRQESFLEDLFG
ncbi:zf-TFIIB domain-containing protein [Saccharothrix algeriensis]|uniref:Transcriptional regulator n=2 Tax=Catellatospora bangladeshensis TaxID=310355 RepID=A0A8J3JFB2_9ACTN|nr:transcriptional regulator [Catellatospora bangladeshensis]